MQYYSKDVNKVQYAYFCVEHLSFFEVDQEISAIIADFAS